jgi:hypothetical protein
MPVNTGFAAAVAAVIFKFHKKRSSSFEGDYFYVRPKSGGISHKIHSKRL